MIDFSAFQALVPTRLIADAPTATPSIWEMVTKGGWTMVPLGLCSLVALTIIVDRLIVTRRASVAPGSLVAAIKESRHDHKSALARCLASPSPLAAVIAAGIKSERLGRAEQEKIVAEAGEREMRQLRHRVRLLSVLPQVATMLGLLGTVLGMIRTFTVVAASGESLGKTERLAQGIYEAWTATAAGLLIAIPVLIAYHVIMSRLDQAAALLDNGAADWLEASASMDTSPLAAAQLVRTPLAQPTHDPAHPSNGTISAAVAQA